MAYVRSLSCCAIKEICSLNRTPKSTLRDVKYEVAQHYLSQAFFLFTDIKRSKKGEALARYITDNNLGKVTQTEYAKNPNSPNQVRIWVWKVKKSEFNKIK